jgi:hypothetical protein
MSQPRKARGAITAGPKEGLRAMGTSEWHPEDCPCRKCRRMRAAVARRRVPRYGQDKGGPR